MGRSTHEAAAVVRVRVPTPLHSYTGAPEVAVAIPVLAPEMPPTLASLRRSTVPIREFAFE